MVFHQNLPCFKGSFALQLIHMNIVTLQRSAPDYSQSGQADGGSSPEYPPASMPHWGPGCTVSYIWPEFPLLLLRCPLLASPRTRKSGFLCAGATYRARPET